MHCPYCLQSLPEHAPACSVCGLNLAQADGFFGRPPVISPPLADGAGMFSEEDAGGLREEIGMWTQQFPQVEFTLVTAGAEAGRPLGTYAFWLFNRGFRQGTSGDGRFGVMLLIEAEGGTAALTVGYGLEPFTSREALQDVLKHAGPMLRERRFPEAARVVLRELGNHFQAVLAGLPRLYGIDPAELRSDSPHEIT